MTKEQIANLPPAIRRALEAKLKAEQASIKAPDPEPAPRGPGYVKAPAKPLRASLSRLAQAIPARDRRPVGKPILPRYYIQVTEGGTRFPIFYSEPTAYLRARGYRDARRKGNVITGSRLGVTFHFGIFDNPNFKR